MTARAANTWRCRCGQPPQVNGCTRARCATPGHRVAIEISETVAPDMTVQIEIGRNNARNGLGTFGFYAEMGGQSIGFPMSRETGEAIMKAFAELTRLSDDDMDQLDEIWRRT